MKRLCLISLAIIPLLLAGCPSFTTLHTATPVEKGTAEVTGAAGVLGANGDFFAAAVPGGDTSGSTNIGGAIPYIGEVHGRYGVSENLGLGAKLSSYGMFGIDANIAPINTDAFALSINPAVTLIPAGFATYGNTEANILFDVVKTESTTFTLGAKPGGIWATGGGEGGFSPYVGGTAGVKFWVNDRVAISPWFDGVYFIDTAGTGNVFAYFAMLGITARVGSPPGE